jgi:WD40 repeat protein
MISKMSPIQVVFSSDPAIELMVVTYADGNMVAYDIWSQRVVTAVEQHCHLVACSADGHTLATASSHGVIELWDFETLRLLYRINPRGTLGKALVFMANGTRIVELRNRKVVVWEPAVLDRGAAGEHACISESGVVAELVAGEEEEEDISSITSVCIHPSEDALIVGKDDGTVSVYSALSGQLQNTLYSHSPMFVRLIATSSSNAVASVDASGMVMAYEVDFKQTGTAATSKQLLCHHFDQLIQQLLLNCAGDKILICTTTHDYLWGRTVGEGFEQTRAIETPSGSMWKWVSPVIEPETLFLIADQGIRRFEWENLKEMIPSSIVDIGPGRLNDSEIALSTLRTDISGMFIVAEFTKKFHAKGTERLVV